MLAAYSTDFKTTENPISEGGKWTANGVDWTSISVAGGLAFGTQSGNGSVLSDTVNDSNACLSGFPADHRAMIVLSRAAGIVSPGLQECEILLRWYTDGAHITQGYEINLAWDGQYSGIVRWNGVYNDFTDLHTVTGNPVPAVQDGDILEGEIIGNTINAYFTPAATGVRQLIQSVTDTAGTDGNAVFKRGNPGIGCYRWNNGGTTNPQSYAIRRFCATRAPAPLLSSMSHGYTHAYR